MTDIRHRPPATTTVSQIPVAGTYALDAAPQAGRLRRPAPDGQQGPRRVRRGHRDHHRRRGPAAVRRSPRPSRPPASTAARSEPRRPPQAAATSSRSRSTRRWSSAAPASSRFDGNEFVLAGELTIKDVTRPVELKVEFEGVGRSPYGQDVFGFSATHRDRPRGLRHDLERGPGDRRRAWSARRSRSRSRARPSARPEPLPAAAGTRVARPRPCTGTSGPAVVGAGRWSCSGVSRWRDGSAGPGPAGAQKRTVRRTSAGTDCGE